jgi:GNAT superfamily N-acetyltransferase
MYEPPVADALRVTVAPSDFNDWTALLELLHSAYAYMASRIDPPSSLLRMDLEQFRQKARDETLIVALDDQHLVGCAFASLRSDCVYVGKLAVDTTVRRKGIARRIMQAAETIARDSGKPFLELETRVELIENHATFAALGFVKVGESAHAGFSRPTSITMRKPIVHR